MRIGIYGGSFDPVHNGHLGVARVAIAELALDRLLVVPAAVSPFKTGGPRSAFGCVGLSPSTRVAAADATERVPPFETAFRLLLVRAAFNGMEKVTVDDRELKRGGVSYAIDTVREIAAENPGAEIIFIIGEDSVEGLPRWKDIDELRRLCTFKSYPRTSESSTEIRRRLAADESIAGLVPAAVDLFIRHGVTYNEAMAATVLKGLERKGGFCPCRLPKLPEFFCPCDEFKAQLADPDYHGLCHCRLYLKP